MLRCFAIAAVCLFVSICPAGAAEKSRHEVDGLKLPAPQEVPIDEQFITLNADCTGTVKWLILTTDTKIKYKIDSARPNEIQVGIPPRKTTITVFAVGIINGKLTDFARTEVTVKGPEPGPTPTPIANLVYPLHVTFIEDPMQRTPEIRSVVESQDLRRRLADRKCITRVYSKDDPVLVARGQKKLVDRHGIPLMIVQDDKGVLLHVSPLPASPEAVLNDIDKIIGKD